MTDYKKPLDDARLETVAQIYNAWWPDQSEIVECRQSGSEYPEPSLAMLTEARRQTGADELAAALRDVVNKWMPLGSPEYKACAAALAAYERIAG